MFDPNTFLEFPHVMHVTEAAAKAMDRAAIKHGVSSAAMPLFVWHSHKRCTIGEIRARAADLANSTAGVFITDTNDNLSVVDTILPPRMRRVYVICTHAEAVAALDNIEDFINHGGHQIIRGANDLWPT